MRHHTPDLATIIDEITSELLASLRRAQSVRDAIAHAPPRTQDARTLIALAALGRNKF